MHKKHTLRHPPKEPHTAGLMAGATIAALAPQAQSGQWFEVEDHAPARPGLVPTQALVETIIDSVAWPTDAVLPKEMRTAGIATVDVHNTEVQLVREVGELLAGQKFTDATHKVPLREKIDRTKQRLAEYYGSDHLGIAGGKATARAQVENVTQQVAKSVLEVTGLQSGKSV